MAHSPKRGKKMQSGKRSPTAHRTLEQARRHWKEYGSKHKDDNRKRTKARRDAIKRGEVKRGDGKDVHHKKPLARGGSNSRKNISVQSRSKNRGHSVKRKKS